MTRIAEQHRVPFLPKKVIEEHADVLLGRWGIDHAAVTEPPVPIEDILEVGLGLAFEVCDLQSEFGHTDVLGGIWFGSRIVKIDQSLDPTIDARMLGRFRFTVAHEIGHWELHRHHLMNDPSAASLFDESDTPAFVCRSSDRPAEEVQANHFAACLLMPRPLVHDAWAKWRGSPDPVSLQELNINPSDEVALDAFCRPLAERFEVSAQPMRYRLEAIGLLVKEHEPQLFS